MAESSVAAQARPPRGSGTLRLPLVHLRYQGRPIGLYGIREIYENALVLLHGPIAFPPGTPSWSRTCSVSMRGCTPERFRLR